MQCLEKQYNIYKKSSIALHHIQYHTGRNISTELNTMLHCNSYIVTQCWLNFVQKCPHIYIKICMTHTSVNTQRQSDAYTLETLYSTIYYSKYFTELNIDKSTQYVALWTHKRHPHTSPFWASYGVSFLSTSTEIDRVIKGFYCMHQ